MRAVVVDRWMEPAELVVRELPDPVVGPGQLGVDVKAAGCNFFDILIVQGRYQVKPPFPFIPGGEIAGVVREIGSGRRSGFAVGDRVLASAPMGGYADRIAIPAAFAHRMPDAMSFEEGASFPIVYPTSYAGLVYRAALQPGETLLVHAAAGGVGLAAVQIGKALGARVIATAGGARQGARRARSRRRLRHRLQQRGLRRAREGDHRRQGRRRDLRLGRRRHLRQVAQVHRLVRTPARDRLRRRHDPERRGEPHPAEEHRRWSVCTGAPTRSTNRRAFPRPSRRCSGSTKRRRSGR